MRKISGYTTIKKYSAVPVLVFVLFLSSCHKEITTSNQTGSTATGNFSQVFEDFWTNMNQDYVFWSIDTTNWDNMHTVYAPKFASLNLYDSTDEVTAYGYFKAMVDGLTDSHYTLLFANGAGIQPAHDRKLNNPMFIENLLKTAPSEPSFDGKYYYTNTLDTAYLGSKVFGVDTTSSNANFYCVSGLVQNSNILYLAFNKFALVSEYQSGPAQVQAALNYFFAQIKNTAITGLIIDVRGNGGGDISDLNFLVGSLISSKLNVGYTRSKSGTGRLDYTPWAPSVVTPTAGATGFTKPIVVLADGESVSMAELTTMSLKQLPNTTFVGDTTWGANGPLTTNSVYSAGSFNFGNYYTNIETGAVSYYGNAYTSSVMFKYINGNIYEGKGFPPDYELKITPDNFYNASGNAHDAQLEKAISLLQ